MQLQSLRETNTRKQRSIRAYLGENHISLQLSVRVKKYVDWKQSTAKSLHFGGEDERFKEVFDSLPRGLQAPGTGPAASRPPQPKPHRPPRHARTLWQ